MNLRRPFFHPFALLVALLVAGAATAAQVPSPEQFLGFRVGTDRKLARWTQVLEYLERVDRASDRVRMTELGKTTMGNRMPMLIVSSPKNLSRLQEIQRDQRRLAYPEELSPGEAEKIAARNPAVVLITLTIHSNEIGSTQMSLEAVHRLATEDSPYVRRLLDNVVLLLVPSVNPDGQVLVIDWYEKNVGTPFEYAPMPWLYHKYTGHDDNRDSYMLTQVESRHVARLLYKEWFPLVFLDEHQMGSSGPRIFVPPFEDPINPNQDPSVIAGSSLLGMQMFNALHNAGYEGVSYGERFSWWWQGSAKNGAWYHNMLGLLTEVASARLASPIEQELARPNAPRRTGESTQDPRKPLPPPTDIRPRANYPRPWTGGTWTLRDIVNYELVVTFSLLESCADRREELQRNFYRLNRKAIESGRKGDPFAYVVPPDQHDPGTAAAMLELLDATGVRVHRARTAFAADGTQYPAGSYVVLMGQSFRNYAKDLLEPQEYPMTTSNGQAPKRPYDVTGWTLPFQMGVKAVRVKERFDASLEEVSPVPLPRGSVEGPADARVFMLPHAWNASAVAVNRLLTTSMPGREVLWTTQELKSGDATYPAGTILVRGGTELRSELEKLARETHVAVTGLGADVTIDALKLRRPRIGLYQPWTANMDEGWTRWVLERYEFPYTTLHNEDLKAGGLGQKLDVILFANQAKGSILSGMQGEWQRPEYHGGIGAEGVQALEEFVRGGGTLVTLGSACELPIEEWKLPVRNVLKGVSAEKFYCPGAILETAVDPAHPVAFGMPERASLYFNNSPAFEISPGAGSGVRAITRYPAGNPLKSGWIGGPEYLSNRAGAVSVEHGKGKVILLGFPVQFRAQPHGTFKLLFNALHWSAAG